MLYVAIGSEQNFLPLSILSRNYKTGNWCMGIFALTTSSRNLVKVAKPVDVKIIGFEWAGEVDSARYPYRRNGHVRYPGKAGALIDGLHLHMSR